MPIPAYFLKQYRWTHTDPNMAKHIESAYLRCKEGNWNSSPEGITDWRAFVYWIYLLRANLSNDPDDAPPPVLTGEGSTVSTQEINGEPFRFSNTEREELSNILGNALVPFCLRDANSRGESELSPPPIFTTITDQPVSTPAGWLFIATVGVIAGAVVACYAVYYGSNIIDRQLAREEDSKRHMYNVGELGKALNEHQTQEKEAGHELPLPEKVKQLSALVREGNQILLSKKETPLPGPLSLSTPTSVSLGLGVALAAVVAGIFLLKGKSHV